MSFFFSSEKAKKKNIEKVRGYTKILVGSSWEYYIRHGKFNLIVMGPCKFCLG